MAMTMRAKLVDPYSGLNGHVCIIPSAVVSQAVAAAGADYVIIDQEHSPMGTKRPMRCLTLLRERILLPRSVSSNLARLTSNAPSIMRSPTFRRYGKQYACRPPPRRCEPQFPPASRWLVVLLLPTLHHLAIKSMGLSAAFPWGREI